MKTLLLLRHAKSSWSDPSLSDHQRPLNKRGRHDAPRIGRLIQHLGLEPQRIICSDAARTLATSRMVMEQTGWECPLTPTPDLYLAPPESYLQILHQMEDSIGCVMMVGHNPGIEATVELLTGELEFTPTGALAHIEFDAESWTHASLDGGARLVDFYRPKEYDFS